MLYFRNYAAALKLMQRATVPPSKKVDYHDDTETVQARLYKSLKVWSMYADLEESYGTYKVPVVHFPIYSIMEKTDSFFKCRIVSLNPQNK